MAGALTARLWVFMHSPLDGCKINSAGSPSLIQWINGKEPASDSILQPSLRAEIPEAGLESGHRPFPALFPVIRNGLKYCKFSCDFLFLDTLFQVIHYKLTVIGEERLCGLTAWLRAFLHSPLDGCKINSAGSFSFFQWMNEREPASDSILQPSLRAEMPEAALESAHRAFPHL